MNMIVSAEAVAQQLNAIRQDIDTEHVKFQGIDLYRCGVVDGRLEALLQLKLISHDMYEEMMALGEGHLMAGEGIACASPPR